MLYTAFYDGSSNPNPGVLGLGFSIYKEREEVICGAGPGGEGTNNIADYKALIWLMDIAYSAGIEEMLIVGDSMLVTNQINGKYRVTSIALKELYNRVTERKKLFKSLVFEWRPREKNLRADKLARRGVELNEPKVFNKVIKETNIESKQTQQVIKCKVQPQGNGQYSFIEMGSPMSILDSNKMACTCANFTAKNTCKHLDVFNLCAESNFQKVVNN